MCCNNSCPCEWLPSRVAKDSRSVLRPSRATVVKVAAMAKVAADMVVVVVDMAALRGTVVEDLARVVSRPRPRALLLVRILSKYFF